MGWKISYFHLFSSSKRCKIAWIEDGTLWIEDTKQGERDLLSNWKDLVEVMPS